jgi:hypothetical protein
MAKRRRLVQWFAFASHAVHHHRFRRRPVLEVREDRVVLATFTVNSSGMGGPVPTTRATCGTASTFE